MTFFLPAVRRVCVRSLVAMGLLVPVATAWAQRVAIQTLPTSPVAGWVDAGAMPVSAPVKDVFVTLKRSDAQQSDLDSFLENVVTPGTAEYHQWLTPAQFADRFEPSTASVATVSQWLTSQGLVVEAVAASRERITAHGTIGAVQTAFATQLDRMRNNSQELYTPTTDLTVPASVSTLVASVQGADELALRPASLTALEQFAESVEGNTSAVLTLSDDSVCTDSDAAMLGKAYLPVLQQAAAQGITVLVSGGCVAQALSPAAAALVTAAHLSSAGTATAVSLAADGTSRPGWQDVTGLPTESVRAVPDLSLSGDTATLSQALQTIVTKAGTRQGSVGSILYSLALTDGVYTQPSSSASTTASTAKAALATSSTTTDASSTTDLWQAGTGLGVVNLEKMIKAWPLGTTATDVSIVSSSYSPTHGTSFTLTVTINGTTTTPSGTVTISSTQGGTLATVAVTSSTVTYSTNSIDGGTYDFKATYSGDSTYAGATSSGSATVTVLGEAASVSASTTSEPLGTNIPVVVTVKSQSGVGTPTGTVTVVPQGTTSSTTYTGTLSSTVTGTATATVSVPTTQAGSLTLLANCVTTSASFTCYTPTSVQATVGKGTPAVALAYTSTSTTSSGTGTLSATVTGATGATSPSGTVQFLDGTTVLGTGTLASGVATYNLALTGSSKHSITATYEGDTNYSTATSSAVSVSGSLVSTTTSLTSSSYATSYGTSVTLTSAITPSSTVDSTSPTGTITFTDSVQGVVGTATLSSGSTTLDLSTLTAGTHSLVATYSGDTNYAASSSTTSVVITVSAVTGTLAATISPTTSVGYGSTAAISVTVTGSSTSAAGPAGAVTATVAGVSGGVYTGALVSGTGSSTATITVPAPPPGSYTVTVACVQTTSLTCSNSVPLTMKVVAGATTTTLTTVPTAPQAGMPVTLTATVAPTTTPTYTVAAISGSVTFTSNGVLLGTGAVSNGVATLTTTLAGGKALALVATYAGDTDWASSASTALSVTPIALTPTIALSSNTLSPLAGSNITLTATVTGPSGSTLIPTGVVTFYDSLNGTLRLLGSANLASNGVDSGVATLSTTGYSAGTHTTYAVYAGDGSFLTAQSASLTITAGDFALTMTPTTTTVTQGATTTVTGLITVQGGFSDTVALGCVPAASTLMNCSFSPSVVSGGGTTTLTITTTAATSTKVTTTATHHPYRWTRDVAGSVLALLFCGFLPYRARRMRSLLMACLVAFLLSSSVGCADGMLNSGAGSGSGSSGGSSGMGGTPLGTTILTLTGAATDGSTVVRHSYSYQVTVQ